MERPAGPLRCPPTKKTYEYKSEKLKVKKKYFVYN
jgi:hypothetical protein